MKVQTNWRNALVPALTESYSPVAHAELIFLLEKELNDSGYKVEDKPSVSQSYNGEQITGMMHIRKENYGGEFSQSLAFMNSYNKRLPIKLASGARAFICENGMVVGEIISLRKHTGEVFPVLKELISNAVSGMESSFTKTQSDVEKMKRVEITSTQAAELIGRMFIDENILNSNEVNEVVRQLRKPRFDDFVPKTMWSLYNHATWAMKGASPDRAMVSLKRLHEFMMNVTNDLMLYV